VALRHVVLFRFSEGATGEQVRALVEGLDRLPELVGTVVAYHHGRDAGVNQGTYDYAVVGDFATVDDYVTYRDHPDHRALVRDLLTPIVTERASIQYELPS
jgi:hypothetical protein